MPSRIQKPRATDAVRPLGDRTPLLEEDLEGKLRRLEEKQSSRPPPAPPSGKREVPFEQLLHDFVSEVSRKRETFPP